MTSYAKLDIPNYALWDANIRYDRKIKGDAEFFTKFTINNILNKKYALNISHIDNVPYRIFGEGRSFMVEAGVKR